MLYEIVLRYKTGSSREVLDGRLELQKAMQKLRLERTADGKLELKQPDLKVDNVMKTGGKIASALEKKITDDLLR